MVANGSQHARRNPRGVQNGEPEDPRMEEQNAETNANNAVPQRNQQPQSANYTDWRKTEEGHVSGQPHVQRTAIHVEATIVASKRAKRDGTTETRQTAKARTRQRFKFCPETRV